MFDNPKLYFTILFCLFLVVSEKYQSRAIDELTIECGKCCKPFKLNRMRYHRHFGDNGEHIYFTQIMVVELDNRVIVMSAKLHSKNISGIGLTSSPHSTNLPIDDILSIYVQVTLERVFFNPSLG